MWTVLSVMLKIGAAVFAGPLVMVFLLLSHLGPAPAVPDCCSVGEFSTWLRIQLQFVFPGSHAVDPALPRSGKTHGDEPCAAGLACRQWGTPRKISAWGTKRDIPIVLCQPRPSEGTMGMDKHFPQGTGGSTPQGMGRDSLRVAERDLVLGKTKQNRDLKYFLSSLSLLLQIYGLFNSLCYLSVSEQMHSLQALRACQLLASCWELWEDFQWEPGQPNNSSRIHETSVCRERQQR